MINKEILKYSEVRQILKLDSRRPKLDDGLSSITHYLQSNMNGAKKYYKKDAICYLKENNLLEEPSFQYQLPIEYDIPFPPPKNAKFKFIDLFAGIGGFRLALQNLGGKCVFTSEWDKYSKQTYKANFPLSLCIFRAERKAIQICPLLHLRQNHNPDKLVQ